MSRPGIIFVSQSFYPGWVTTDKHYEMAKVFGAFQGIVIPEAGHGHITVCFSPSALKWGAVITIMSAIAASLIVVKWGR